MYIQYVFTQSLPFIFHVVPYPTVLQIECRFSHMLYVLFVRIFKYYIMYCALRALVHPFVCTVLNPYTDFGTEM